MKTLKILTMATLVTAALVASGQGGQSEPVRVVVDGHEMHFPNQQPIQHNGRVLVPLRGVFERLGAEVNWDSDTQTVTARKRGVRVKIEIGQSHAWINDEDRPMDTPARVIGGSTMVPLRFVSEALGADVNWNEAAMEVDISAGGGDDGAHRRQHSGDHQGR